MIKVQSKDKRSPYSIEIVYEPRSEDAKQLNEYKKNGQYHYVSSKAPGKRPLYLLEIQIVI